MHLKYLPEENYLLLIGSNFVPAGSQYLNVNSKQRSLSLMEKLFQAYKNLLEERLNRKPLLLLGEDSIRYDFFAALMEAYSFRPSQIQIEVPINSQTFIPAKEKISYRNEKPLIDLVIDEPGLRLSAEFGLFRQNSNEDGTINKTARLVKMLNDMIRVSLEAHFTNTTGLFICVADHKMIGHQIRSNIVDPFPADYVINNDIINHQLEQKTNKFDKRFLKVFQPLKKDIASTLIVNEQLRAKKIKHETRLLIWKVSITGMPTTNIGIVNNGS
ncbi:MAG: hypothetical protein JO154_06960 [Chitinophaga sp.]|uniref:hypothetical protein n=1 Tax=Chitinophaga sp. TaxID=1869181 RepID=UPI0025BE5C27|nr:hypothetical protein [Chitinophaga sp.]MBV8252331.1 hypothetical protein [Chitinophaga sp.]